MDHASLCRGDAVYAPMADFFRAHAQMTYPQFDRAVMEELRLFDVPDSEMLAAVEQTADRIIRALPAVQRIFARPIIRLRDTQEIVPIESVRMTDSHALFHAASHSELWEDIVDGCIRPRKLMTVTYIETYAIYENIVLARTVDAILSFVRHTVLQLRDSLYGCRDLHFNLLDRTHHSLYFLALGKLHLEYAHARASHTDPARCIEKLLFIDRSLRPKLSAPLYRSCKGKRLTEAPKKTNIFRSHKDYKAVYDLALLLAAGAEETDTALSPQSEGYRAYVRFLALFAMGHYHFAFPQEAFWERDRFRAECAFRRWRLTLTAVSDGTVNALRFAMHKDRSHTACLLLCEKADLTEGQLAAFQQAYPAEEYLFCSPNSGGDTDALYLSIYDIDSFRRIQQLLLRGMILADETHDICPFCGSPTRRTEQGYQCDVCRAEIARARCPESGRPYWTSGILHHTSPMALERDHRERRQFLHDRMNESRLHFRNITPLAPDGTPLCPHCGRPHATAQATAPQA